jgi:hypothetical protein
VVHLLGAGHRLEVPCDFISVTVTIVNQAVASVKIS